MIEKSCEIKNIGESVESMINRLFNGDISFISEGSQQLCRVAESNMLLAMLMAFALPFFEAFFPMLPYSAFVIFNVNLLGTFLGFVLSIAGTVFGSYILFFCIRFFFQERMLHFLEKYNQLGLYNKVVSGVEKHGILYVFLVYGVLGLILPSSICTISIAITSFSKRKYFLGLLLGKSLITGILVLFGKSIVDIFSNPLILVAVVILGGFIYFCSKKLGKHLNFE